MWKYEFLYLFWTGREGLGQTETQEAVLPLMVLLSASEVLTTNYTPTRVTWTHLKTSEVWRVESVAKKDQGSYCRCRLPSSYSAK